MIRFWLLALRNLKRNLKRNVATGSAIALGFAGIILLGAYAHRVDKYLAAFTIYVNHTGHLALFAKDGFEKLRHRPASFSLSESDQKLIDSTLSAQGNIEIYERQLSGQGLIGNGCISFPFVAVGIEPGVDKLLREHEQVKQWMRPKFDFFQRGKGLWEYPDSLAPILLSKGLALALGKTKVHDEVSEAPATLANCADPNYKTQMSKDANVQLLSGTWEGALSAVDGESVGLFSSGFQEADNSAILAPVFLLQKLFDTTQINQYGIWLKNPELIASTINELRSSFSQSGKEYEIVRWDEERLSPYYVGTIKFLKVIVLAVAIILTLIVALSVLNSVTMTVLERAQEIGMYRSMGFRKSQVQLLYLQESIWLALLSLFIGLIVGLTSMYFINAAKVIYHPPGISGGLQLLLIFHWPSAAISFVVIILAVFFTTFFAVANRLRLVPADLLGGTLR